MVYFHIILRVQPDGATDILPKLGELLSSKPAKPRNLST